MKKNEAFSAPSPLRIAKMFLGAILIVLGLIAMVMPLVPGAWLVFIGLELLGIRYVVWDSNDRIGKFLLKIGVPKKYLK